MKKLIAELAETLSELIDIVAQPNTEIVDEEAGILVVKNYKGETLESIKISKFSTLKKEPADLGPIDDFYDNDWIRKDWEQHTYDYGL